VLTDETGKRKLRSAGVNEAASIDKLSRVEEKACDLMLRWIIYSSGGKREKAMHGKLQRSVI